VKDLIKLRFSFYPMWFLTRITPLCPFNGGMLVAILTSNEYNYKVYTSNQYNQYQKIQINASKNLFNVIFYLFQ